MGVEETFSSNGSRIHFIGKLSSLLYNVNVNVEKRDVIECEYVTSCTSLQVPDFFSNFM